MKRLGFLLLVFSPLMGSSTNPQRYTIELEAVRMPPLRLFLHIEPNTEPDIEAPVIEPREELPRMTATRSSNCVWCCCGALGLFAVAVLVVIAAKIAGRI